MKLSTLLCKGLPANPYGAIIARRSSGAVKRQNLKPKEKYPFQRITNALLEAMQLVIFGKHDDQRSFEMLCKDLQKSLPREIGVGELCSPLNDYLKRYLL